MEYKDGQYYYAPHRRMWGVWKWHRFESGGGAGTFYKDFVTKEDARDEVYRLNGWKNRK